MSCHDDQMNTPPVAEALLRVISARDYMITKLQLANARDHKVLREIQRNARYM